MAYAYESLDCAICKRGEILSVPPRIRDDTESVFSSKPVLEAATWMAEQCDWVPRASADKSTDVLERYCDAASLSIKLGKAQLVGAGAVEISNGAQRVWTFRHPKWVDEKAPVLSAKLPGLKLKL